MIKQRQEKRERKEYIETVTEHYCDLCNKETDKDCEIEREINCYNFGDSVGHTRIFFDICSECFENVLIPRLKELGLQPMVEEYSDGHYEYVTYEEFYVR